MPEPGGAHPNEFAGPGTPTWKLTLKAGETKRVYLRVKTKDVIIQTPKVTIEDERVTKIQAPVYKAHHLGTEVAASPDANPMLSIKRNFVADMGFRPYPNGLRFTNYSDPKDTDLTVEDMIEVFEWGPVCKNSSGKCIEKSNISLHREAFIAVGNGGHCVGLAVSALKIFRDLDLSASFFQPGALNSIDILKPNLRKSVARYALLQTAKPVNPNLEASFKSVDPGKILIELKNNLNNSKPSDRYTLSLKRLVNGVQRDGHRVVPYRVEKLNTAENSFRVYVYDPNFPDISQNLKERFVSFKKETGTDKWIWEFSGNPLANAKKLFPYKGDGTVGNMVLRSLNYDVEIPRKLGECTADKVYVSLKDDKTEKKFCVTWDEYKEGNNDKATKYIRPDGFLVILDGAANPLITRSDGAKIGLDPETGTWISQIPGAEQVHYQRGLESVHSPMIRLPYASGMTYDIKAYPTETSAVEGVDLFVLSETFSVNVTGLTVHPGEAASFGMVISQDQKSIALRANSQGVQTKEIDVAVARDDGPDILVKLSNVSISAGEIFGAAYDLAAERFTVEDQNNVQTVYDWNIKQVPAGTPTITFDGTYLDEGKHSLSVSIPTGGWGFALPEVYRGSTAKIIPALMTAKVLTSYLDDGHVTIKSVNFPDRSLIAGTNGDVFLSGRSQSFPKGFEFLINRVTGAEAANGGNAVELVDTVGRVLTATGMGGEVAFKARTPSYASGSTQFRIVPGLTEAGISFESVLRPNHYLRHAGFKLKLSAESDSYLFREDASFIAATGLPSK